MTTETKPKRKPMLNRQYKIDDLVFSDTNTRKHFGREEMDSLAESIRDVGFFTQILIRNHPTEAGKFEIIAGERRVKAAIKAGLKWVDCRVVSANNREALLMQTDENLARVQLNPLEEAAAYQQLIDEADMTQEKIAERYHCHQSQISNRLRLLKLPKVWQKKLINGAVPVTFARELASWIKYPQIFEPLDEAVQRIKQNLAPGAEMELSDYRAALADAIDEVSEPFYKMGPLGTGAKLCKELDVVKIPDTLMNGGEQRIFNTERLAELLQELEWADEARNEEAAEADEAAQEPPEPQEDAPMLFDDSEDVEPEESTSERTPEDIQAKSAPDSLANHAQEVADRNNAAKGPPVDYTKYKLNLIRRQIAARLDNDDFVFRVGFDCLDNLADWKPDEPFLKLHSHGQLLELAREWGLDMSRLEGYETASQTMIDEILIMTTQQRIDFGDDINQRPNPPRELILTGARP